MSIIGRKAGFIYASIGSSLSSLLAAYSIINQSFFLFSLACFLLGTGLAFGHQYRFAAVETVKKDMAPKAISIILLAGIASAFIGPNVANLAKETIVSEIIASRPLHSSLEFCSMWRRARQSQQLSFRSGRPSVGGRT